MQSRYETEAAAEVAAARGSKTEEAALEGLHAQLELHNKVGLEAPRFP